MGKEKKTGRMHLYGEICGYGENSAAVFTARFNEAARGADEIDVYVHTYGGDVLEGTLIYNHIKECSIPVNVYIVGVCCSMGTILMMAATKVWMCENSYLMIHAPRGGCYGTAADIEKAAKMLRGIERNFKKIYATKTGRDEDGVKELLDGENWFTAQEAVEAKLIDGIVAPIATGVTQVSAEELQQQTPSALYNRFSACLKPGGEETVNIDKYKNESEMDKKGLIEQFGLTGVTEQSTDKEIKDAIQTRLDVEKQRADTAEQTVASAKKKQITDVVDTAINAKKIAAEQKGVFVGIGEKSGYEALVSALGAIRPVPSLTAAARGDASGTASLIVSRADWTWEQWQKEDPRGLETMLKDEPERFNAMYKVAFKG